MRIVVAMDSFKGSLSSGEANQAVSRALIGHDVTCIPISDGGEGFLDAWLVMHADGTVIEENVMCLDGTKRVARFGFNPSTRHAVIEVAETTGLTLISHVDPWRYSSVGVGHQMIQALNRGAKVVTIGLGGSGTIDGGKGMLEVLGVRFLDAFGSITPSIPHQLQDVRSIDWSGLDPRVREVEWRIASDVRNPLTGENGAAFVFGGQKGLATNDTVPYDRILHDYANCFERDMRAVRGAGAAGGIGFALLQLGATYVSGIEEVVRWSKFEEQIKSADWLITGEGKFDVQSLEGKAPYGLARLAHTHGVPTLVFTGQSDFTSHLESGIIAIFPIVSRIMTLEEAIWEAAPLLTSAVQRVRHVIEKAPRQ
ncbi:MULTISPECIES: glycerate kinase [unclassified Exiguobacterium]|uniref:glycerate kinase family protein n=1 Tax=unclassified Exiguobacterium TaxID=2644629 RepID=UPI001BEA8330|nr:MULTISPECIES: glycerate kinase [unclassified Exiguobacterium]